jgi:hypothetical protein
MPWQHNAALATSDKLSSSLGALSLAPAAPALAQWGQQWPQACGQAWPQALSQQLGQPFGQQLGQQLGQPFGQPCAQACAQPCAHAFGQAYGAWPAATGAPAVDMLVLPSGDACAVQSSSDSKQDVVKVSYTSAQDLAEALFPTGAPANTDIDAQLERHSAHIDDLSEHRELVHEALLDHRDKVQQLHATVSQVRDGMNLADRGLMDHKKHIRDLKSSNSAALQKIDAHAKQLSKIESDIKMLSSSHKSMDMGLKAHAKVFELQNSTLHTLATKQDAVSKDVASLSKTLQSENPAQQEQDRQKQIKQLEKTMLDTQAQLARLTSQATMTNVTVNGPRVMRKV